MTSSDKLLRTTSIFCSANMDVRIVTITDNLWDPWFVNALDAKSREKHDTIVLVNINIRYLHDYMKPKYYKVPEKCQCETCHLMMQIN